MNVVPHSEEDKAVLAAHLAWERMVLERCEVQHTAQHPYEPHELGLCPFAAGWEAGRQYEAAHSKASR
jgi:hypothetical protein